MLSPNAPPAVRPSCPYAGQQGVNLTCAHGTSVFLPLPCREYETCAACANDWRLQQYRKIKAGLDEQPGLYQFVTLTLCRHTSFDGDMDGYCPQCRKPATRLVKPTPSALMMAWDRFVRRYRYLHKESLQFWRVIETHRDGVPHLHAVIRGNPLPNIAKPLPLEGLWHYRNRQSWAAQKQIAEFVSCGFGVIAHVEKCYGNGEFAARYLCKYLSKGSHSVQLRHPSGRRIRISEGSRSWKLPPGLPPLFRYNLDGYVANPLYAADNHHCDDCDTDDLSVLGHHHWSRRYANRWLKPVEDNEIFWQLRDFLLHHNRRIACHYAVRSKAAKIIDWFRAHYIVDQDALANYEADYQWHDDQLMASRSAREAVLDSIRILGYAGPISLLEVR